MLDQEIETQVFDLLRQTYDIVYLGHVSYFYSSPVNQLYKELAKIRQQSYENNQRIVLVDNLVTKQSKQYFYNYLQKILANLDITNFFVLVMTSDSAVKDYVKQAQSKYSQDETSIQIEQISLPAVTVTSETNFNIPDTVCVTPWLNLEIQVSGRVSPCCLYNQKSTAGDLITEKSLLDIKDNATQISLREQFLQGKKPVGCQKCWDDEQNNKVSKRLHDNFVFRKNLFDIDYNAVDSCQLTALDIKLKNTCNLSCRICNPSFSTKWYNEWQQNQTSYPQWNLLKNSKTQWTDDAESNLWKDINKIGDDLEYITFSGGEPLLDKFHAHMLQYFVERGLSSNINLHYNTNGTVYADHLIDLWNKFKTVELTFSLDNVGAKFEYERYGAVWTDVVNNIKQYQQLDSSIYVFNVYSTITMLNILDSYDMFQFCKKQGLSLAFSVLTDPEELNIRSFSSDQKNYVVQKLKNIQDNEFSTVIDPIIGIMNHANSNIKQSQMINYLDITDQIRGQNFRQTYTELSGVLNQE